jgi:hypothetical protein
VTLCEASLSVGCSEAAMSGNIERGAAGKQVAKNIVRILAIVFVLLGVVLLLVEGRFHSSTLQSILVNIGSGFLSAGILAFVFEHLTRESSWLVNEQIKEDITKEVSRLLASEEGLSGTLLHEIHRQSLESRTMLWEMMRSAFIEDVQKHVFAAGLVGAFELWAGRVPKDFLQSELDLRIMLKDGFSFFSERKQELKERFRKKNLQTKILMLHPNYPFMPAVAQMDHVKAEEVAKQVADCRFGILTMQQIRSELLSETERIDISDRVEFLGYSLVPTWTGFIGSSLAYVSMYFTRPYRGNLNTLIIRSTDDRGQETPYYQSMFREFEEIRRHLLDQESARLFEMKWK